MVIEDLGEDRGVDGHSSRCSAGVRVRFESSEENKGENGFETRRIRECDLRSGARRGGKIKIQRRHSDTTCRDV